MDCSLTSIDERPRFTQGRQGVAGHMVGQRRKRVVRLELLARHEHCHDIPSRAGYSDVAGALLELPLSVTMRTSEVARVCQSVRAVMNRA